MTELLNEIQEISMRQIVGFVLLGLFAPLALAVPTEVVPEPGPLEKTKKALEASVTLNLQNVSIDHAIEQLQELGKVTILLDRTGLAGIGLAPEEIQVTLRVRNVKLKTALRHLATQFNLEYFLDQEIIVLTSHEIANQRQIRQRVDLDLEKQPLKKALQQLSQRTGVNLVLDPRQHAKGNEPITLKLEDAPLDVAVKLLAEIVGLRAVRMSNVLFITTAESSDGLRGEASPLEQMMHAPGVIIPCRARVREALRQNQIVPAQAAPPPLPAVEPPGKGVQILPAQEADVKVVDPQ
jgi:type II secretory pathway component GspD/PulD (secretin)